MWGTKKNGGFCVKLENNFQFYDMLIFIKIVFSWIKDLETGEWQVQDQDCGLFLQESRVEP